jgi:hypothetical protein
MSLRCPEFVDDLRDDGGAPDGLFFFFELA